MALETDSYSFDPIPDLSTLLIEDMALVKVSETAQEVVSKILSLIKSRFLNATSTIPKMIKNSNDEITIELLSKLYQGRSGYISSMYIDKKEQEFKIILHDSLNKASGLSYKKLHKMYIHGTSKTPKFNFMPSQKEVHNMARKMKGQLQNSIMRESIRILTNV